MSYVVVGGTYRSCDNVMCDNEYSYDGIKACGLEFCSRTCCIMMFKEEGVLEDDFGNVGDHMFKKMESVVLKFNKNKKKMEDVKVELNKSCVLDSEYFERLIGGLVDEAAIAEGQEDDLDMEIDKEIIHIVDRVGAKTFLLFLYKIWWMITDMQIGIANEMLDDKIQELMDNRKKKQ